MSDDRDYGRRQDELRDERRREWLLNEYRREDERRIEREWDWKREDHEYEERQRDARRRQAREDLRRGHTAWALNGIAGPDAAIDYLRAMEGGERDATTGGERDEIGAAHWSPPHTFVRTIEQLLDNVTAIPPGARLDALRIDDDGDALVEVTFGWGFRRPLLASLLGIDAPPATGQFYVRAELIESIAKVAATLGRAAQLTADIEKLATEA